MSALRLSLLLSVTISGCQCAWQCSTTTVISPGRSACSPDCCDGWQCASDLYEVKCSFDADAGVENCACLENGVQTRTFSFRGWCGGDWVERTNSANGQCGWRLGDSRGLLPPPS